MVCFLLQSLPGHSCGELHHFLGRRASVQRPHPLPWPLFVRLWRRLHKHDAQRESETRVWPSAAIEYFHDYRAPWHQPEWTRLHNYNLICAQTIPGQSCFSFAIPYSRLDGVIVLTHKFSKHFLSVLEMFFEVSTPSVFPILALSQFFWKIWVGSLLKIIFLFKICE